MKIQKLILAALLVLSGLVPGLQAALMPKDTDKDVVAGIQRGKEDAEAGVKGGKDPQVREGYKRGKREAKSRVDASKNKENHSHYHVHVSANQPGN